MLAVGTPIPPSASSDTKWAGTPLLFQNLFWFYSLGRRHHDSAVEGVISELIACFSHKASRPTKLSPVTVSPSRFGFGLGRTTCSYRNSLYASIAFFVHQFFRSACRQPSKCLTGRPIYRGASSLRHPMLYASGSSALPIRRLTDVPGIAGVDVHVTGHLLRDSPLPDVMVGGVVMGIATVACILVAQKSNGRMYPEGWANLRALVFVGSTWPSSRKLFWGTSEAARYWQISSGISSAERSFPRAQAYCRGLSLADDLLRLVARYGPSRVRIRGAPDSNGKQHRRQANV